MSSIPPIKEVCDAFVFAVLPAFGIPVLIARLTPKNLGRRVELIIAALAFIVGIAAANYFRGCFVLRWEPDRPLSPSDLLRGIWSTLSGESVLSGGTESGSVDVPRAGRYWMPWAALLALAGGLVIRICAIPSLVAEFVKLIIAMLAAKLVVPAGLASGSSWLVWLVGIVIFSLWIIADRRSVRVPSGVPLAAAGLASLGAAAVLLHAHSARLTDVATLIAFASLGISLAASWNRIDAAGAAPAIAVALPAILVSGHYETFSEVPLMAFVLPALAPLTIGLLPLLPDRFLNRWRVWLIAALLVGLPTIAAVVLASRAETLNFSEHSRQESTSFARLMQPQRTVL